jgi:hypothetical protein
MASYNLEDVAQLWYIQLQEDEGMSRWGRFKDLLNLRFGPPLRAAPLFELTECQRSRTVEEYSDRFQALLPRAGRLDEIQRVQLYTGGLLPPLSHAVRIHNPKTLAAAMNLARQIELMESDRSAPAPARTTPRGLLPTPAPRPASVGPLNRARSRRHRWASPRPRREQPEVADPRGTGGAASSWALF